MMVSVEAVPGTDLDRLAQRLADAVVGLSAPAAAMLGVLDIPEDILDTARELGERQGMLAEAAADVGLFAARLWFRPSPDLPADADEVAIAVRELWDRTVRGADASGMTSVSCLPVDPHTWPRIALACRSLAVTIGAVPGLLPADAR
jgi:hypothetical protein